MSLKFNSSDYLLSKAGNKIYRPYHKQGNSHVIVFMPFKLLEWNFI